MKIVLHGATSNTNFGDVLFADLFYKKIVALNGAENTYFMEMPKYGINDFYRRELGYQQHMPNDFLHESELLVYISGGYFGETGPSLQEAVKRYLRYCRIGNYFRKHKKSIVILGVGGGPITNKLLRKVFCNLIDASEIVQVRDSETKEYYVSYGCDPEKIKVTSDTAQVISPAILPALDSGVANEIHEVFGDSKKVFLHLPAVPIIDERFATSVIPALNRFLHEHQEYGVIIGGDDVSSIAFEHTKSYHALKCKKLYLYRYVGAWQLCSLLDQTDLIVTPKLHVGIVGAALSKSVISFPYHINKTKRYYHQIGEEDRCKLLKEINQSDVYEKLYRYHDLPIVISDEIRQLAMSNLNAIERILTV